MTAAERVEAEKVKMAEEKKKHEQEMRTKRLAGAPVSSIYLYIQERASEREGERERETYPPASLRAVC